MGRSELILFTNEIERKLCYEVSKKEITYTNFRNVTISELIMLIRASENVEDNKIVESYANRLFRFFEINKWTYKQAVVSKKLSHTESLLFHNLLVAFFLVRYEHDRDIRYLNTVLKLSDHKFPTFSLFKNSKTEEIIKKLGSWNSDAINRLIQEYG